MASTTAPLMVMDVTTAFLHADLPRDVHVKIRGEVFRLHKALYGLKDSPRLFHQHIHSILTRLSWQATITDPCLYTRQHQQHGQTYLMVYVDDLLYVGGGQKEVVEELRPHLQIKHKQGQQHDYLGIRITRTTTSAATTTSTTTTISLTPYLSAIAGIGPFRVSTPITIDHGRQIQGGGKEGAMVSGGGRADNKEQTRQQQLPLTQQKQHKHRLKEYQQVLGTLTYAASTARPDLAYAASVLASKIGHVSTHDVQMARRALQYAKSHNNILTTTVEHTTGAAACGYYTTAQLSDLEKGQQFPTAQIVTYVDASFAMDAGRRSRSGIVICVNNMPVYWRSSKQTITALSAAEAEYSAITEGIKHTIHVRDQLDEMMIKHSTPVILTDSMSAIHMANSDKIQERTKHLGIRMQFTRDHVRKQTVELQHVPSGDQVADMLTKPLHKGAFHRLVQKIMHHE
ncbi:hypothetical protein PTSG_12360 [Salpingoeca rosetta]|uniref:Reverse transcriptase Ty1/copia-type domain-containing protein n=1 Tax=Salpingoeca rosetta (strain ATCC 50818 / BSB-021) TaxID=946362 RepID=F2UB83_SALR5|nr:uncharacterized protein PTSG_12360 [Salpingoeca rosetta]EGD74096.1 hypothetical protein PTSG_12360 [Salpingoeca rosetta]|eukprot:XP_004993658.1 hypothetical protein PTSG_12360 [Salpingoeca rosetta]